MKRSLLLFALCLLLIGQSSIVLVSGLVEHHPLPSVHAVMGGVLTACTSVHLLVHRGWIKNTLSGFSRLPRSMQLSCSPKCPPARRICNLCSHRRVGIDPSVSFDGSSAFAFGCERGRFTSEPLIPAPQVDPEYAWKLIYPFHSQHVRAF